MSLARMTVVAAVLAAAALAMAPATARAGLAPENVAVVVNADSWASLAVANEYIRLRGIPARNVVYIKGLPQINGFPSCMFTDLPTFRDKILTPIFETLKQRGVLDQIDCIAYSTDMPYAVWFTPATRMGEEASITGLTYLHQMVLESKVPTTATLPAVSWQTTRQMVDQLVFLGRNTNGYFRRAEKDGRQFKLQPPTGFSSTQPWDSAGNKVAADKGVRYMMSVMLAYTSGKGNSVTEAVACLRRAAGADGTTPDGTIYIVKNSNLRSTIREWAFEDTVAKLKASGIKAEIIDGIRPKDELTCPPSKSDVAGAVLGMSDYDWKACGSTIMPGAIVENLTSYGGSMRDGGGQTPISEFLRFGAAGSSGTVTEPGGIQWKFPTPYIQVFYTSGYTLAESFYMSIQAPYQILVVGDPLCKPWAKSPVVTIKNLKAGAEVKGKFAVQPQVTMPPGKKLGKLDVYVDGQRLAAIGPTVASVPLNSETLPDGYHELRLVAVADDDAATKGDCTLPITVANRGLKAEITVANRKAALDRMVVIQARMPRAKKIAIMHNERNLGSIEGESGKLEIPASVLGLGPVSLQAIGSVGQGASAEVKDLCVSAPLEMEVTPPKPMPALKDVPAKLDLGLKLTNTTKNESRVVLRARSGNWISQAVKSGEGYTLEGYFEAPATDMYQFQIRSAAKATIEIDGTVVGEGGENLYKLVPVSLAQGAHKMVVKAGASAKIVLDLWAGGPGTLPVGQAAVVNLKPPTFTHVPFETSLPPIYTPGDPQAGMKPLPTQPATKASAPNK